ncbi:MAG: ferritin family protein [Planctomycetota bacterium]|jgi:rubrerythrin
MKQFLRTIEDILDYAIEQEDEANSFYTHLAQDVQKAELREALKSFAADEFQHKLRLEGVREGQIELTPEEIGTFHIAEQIGYVKPREDMSYKELLAFAIKKEAQAEQLYLKLAEVTKHPEWSELFKLLAQEEARHKFNLEIEYDLTTF